VISPSLPLPKTLVAPHATPFINAPVAVNTPDCVMVTLGLPVGHAEKAVAPLDSVVVFPPLVAVRVVEASVHPPTVPVSNVQDLPVIFRVEIFEAVIVLVAISFAVIDQATMEEASIFCPPCPCITV